jgi:hypothetical protein
MNKDIGQQVDNNHIVNLMLTKNGASFEIIKDVQKNNYENAIIDWLLKKNILPKASMLFSYSDGKVWNRGGAETYSCTFGIEYQITKTQERVNKVINMKALVSTPIEHKLKEWERRRSLLQKNKIPVSNWYSFGTGLILEDYYPEDYKSVKNIEELITIAIGLDKLGSSTLNFLRDIRCNTEGNPFYVDFGFDLGEPSSNPTYNASQTLLNEYPGKKHIIKSFINNKF